jgi:hypothetical protein
VVVAPRSSFDAGADGFDQRYTIGHVDEQFIAVRSIECPDDHAAIRQARQMLDGHSLEVWELERFVIRLDDPG